MNWTGIYIHAWFYVTCMQPKYFDAIFTTLTMLMFIFRINLVNFSVNFHLKIGFLIKLFIKIKFLKSISAKYNIRLLLAQIEFGL